MSGFSRVGAVAALALGLVTSASAAPTLAPTSVAAKLQLHGHLPDLGDGASLRVFPSADAYDSFRVSADVADYFPDSGSLFMTFDREMLALYHRGDDSGGRCLRSNPTAGIAGDTVTLDLFWEAGTCGAPAGAHYPFVLVSLSRVADDGSAWIAPGRQVCASAPGVAGTRACAPVTGAAPTPSPARTAAPTPAPTAAPTLTPFATPTPPRTLAASPAPTRTATAVPTLAVVSPSPSPFAQASELPSSDRGSDLLSVGGWVGLGFVIGVIVVALVLASRRDVRV